MSIDVSIIIPTYNRLWCLPRAIESCRNTNCRCEIIVVDDGSTDGTLEWLQQQVNLIFLRQENQGQTYAINAGTKLATGKYIRFLDSDDFLEQAIIDLQFKKAEETNANLVYSRVDNYFEETKEITKNPDVPLWEDFMSIQLSSNYGSHFLGMLFARDLITNIPRRPDFAFREDRMFLLEVALTEPKIAMVPGCGGYWVKHKDQMQGNYFGLKSQVTNWQHLQLYKKILGKLDQNGKLTKERKKAACTVLWPLAHWIAKDNIYEAKLVYDWIKELDPEFKSKGSGLNNMLVRTIGFSATEKILKLRRFFKYGIN